ncbi:MAG: glycosyltransferase [Pseudomonadota bacterium]
MALRLLQILVGEPKGGAEAFFVKLAGALQKRGVDQLLAIRRDAARCDALTAAGCVVEQFEFGDNIIRDYAERWRLAQITRTFRPSLALAWMNRAARRMPRGAFVKVGRIGGYYRARNYRRCDWIIANSPDLQRFIVEDGWPDDRAVMISNFGELPAAKPAARAEFDTPEDAPLLLALGRLHPSKGFDLLVAAAAEIPDAYVWIAGSGDELLALQAQAKSLGVADRVRFLGWRGDQSALLQSCDVCVVPSRHEPLSNVTIEAWSLGVPVVAAASEGPSWLVDDEENGLLAPVDDASALATQLRRVLQDDTLRNTIATGGHAKWSAHFSEDAIVDRYLAFFDRAMAAQQR